jgi:hypothetical protein
MNKYIKALLTCVVNRAFYLRKNIVWVNLQMDIEIKWINGTLLRGFSLTRSLIHSLRFKSNLDVK